MIIMKAAFFDENGDHYTIHHPILRRGAELHRLKSYKKGWGFSVSCLGRVKSTYRREDDQLYDYIVYVNRMREDYRNRYSVGYIIGDVQGISTTEVRERLKVLLYEGGFDRLIEGVEP